MKLFIFGVWAGYVYMNYYPIVAEDEDDARKILKPLIKHIMDRRNPDTKYVNDFMVSVELPLPKGFVENLYFEFSE